MNSPPQRPQTQDGVALTRVNTDHLNEAGIYHSYSYDDHARQVSDAEEETRREPKSRVESPSSSSEHDVEKYDLESGERVPSQTLSIARAQPRASTPPLEHVHSKGPDIVGWDGPDDPANPKNWSFKKRMAATFVVSSFTFISPVSSSMCAPALPALAKELGITEEFEKSLTLSIFILAYAVGPLFIGPLSEIYGRVPVLQLGNFFFMAFNLGCGASQTKTQILIFRFLSGLGGSAPLSVGAGILSDMWKADERGLAISYYSLAPLLGPTIGPLAGGFIAENVSWRWVFWSTSIVAVLVQCSGLFLLRETYAPKLLGNKAARLRKETGNTNLRTEYESPERSSSKILSTALTRPFRLLGTQPIVQALAIYMAYIYGLMYLVLATFPTLWTDTYNESVGIGGLNYISIGLGFFLSSQICARLNDIIYKRLRMKNNGKGEPEFRVPLMFIGSSLIPIGLFWYGWSAEKHLHWIMPNIGILIFAAGVITCFQCIQTYIIDSYTRFAASAIGAATCLRSIAGFGFPLFAPYMYQKLGNGWGNSLLGFIALALGVPAPFVLWKFGAVLRSKSQFAAGG